MPQLRIPFQALTFPTKSYRWDDGSFVSKVCYAIHQPEFLSYVCRLVEKGQAAIIISSGKRPLRRLLFRKSYVSIAFDSRDGNTSLSTLLHDWQI